ncbi:restriction endonuclease subunit S [Acinetobacter towneri]|uniref:restriction endonuclease subunit S n=1 Tax=Acinetobacter towneri TaxID=202956 RepID=UPI0029353428|nr:restriction endonuclease subunit S [Acinetobacter towneri]MDV2485385.1 restriction endonuclease subunit S [Acinetobacter towneri]
MAAPQLRFKEFDGEWNNFELGTLGYFINGLTYAPENIVEKGLLVLRSSNVQNGELAFEDNVFVDLNVDQEKLTQKNDILICVRNGSKSLIGKNALIKDLPCSATHGAFMTVFRSGLGEFVYQLLQTKRYYEYIYADLGATINSINGNNLKKYKFYLPEKKEQTKIASFLSAVDEKISQLTQKHELLSQYKQGMMQKLFSQQIRFKADDGSEFGEWEEKLIKDIADVKGGKRIPKGYPLVNENTGHPYITVSDMNRYYSIDSTNIRYVPLEVVDTIKRYTITDKDIFISVAGTLGIIGKIPTEFNGANLTENADKLTNLKCHQDFLIYLLDSGYLSELIESTATTSAQPKLALYAIEQLEVQIPCPEEQTKIANFLSAIDQKIEVVAQQIEQAKQWKKGLLQQMFV